MFSGFMVGAWEAGTLCALVAGVVGFFVVLRGSAFAAHAIPKGAFAGAAGASLIGASTLLGLGVFSALSALGIGALSRRGRSDVATALTLVLMLAVGAAFLSQGTQYAPEIYSLLFGEILGVTSSELAPTAILGAVCVLVVAVFSRRLLLTSLLPEVATAKGIRPQVVEYTFLLVVACATTMTVPVVGSLLMFSLMVGPPAAARSLTVRPGAAVAASVVIALVTVWLSIALSFESDWPVGFYVGVLSAGWYCAVRAGGALVAVRRDRRRPGARVVVAAGPASP